LSDHQPSPKTPMVSFATSQTVNLDPKDLQLDFPPDMVTHVCIERSRELASFARGIFEAGPDAAQMPLEADASGQDGTMDMAYLPETICGVGRKPLDIAFNGGKIHNVRFNCDNIRNISFNGGNMRNISFGFPLYSGIEEDKAPKPTEPGTRPSAAFSAPLPDYPSPTKSEVYRIFDVAGRGYRPTGYRRPSYR
jgi:hypothetical protein